jgi:hypothetical protein
MMKPTTAITACLLAAALAIGAALAQSGGASKASSTAPAGKSDDKHRLEDIAKHRRIAQAHEQAARCLEAGEKESACHDKLRTACQGIAVGKYCGMRH